MWLLEMDTFTYSDWTMLIWNDARVKEGTSWNISTQEVVSLAADS